MRGQEIFLCDAHHIDDLFLGWGVHPWGWDGLCTLLGSTVNVTGMVCVRSWDELCTPLGWFVYATHGENAQESPESQGKIGVQFSPL